MRTASTPQATSLNYVLGQNNIEHNQRHAQTIRWALNPSPDDRLG